MKTLRLFAAALLFSPAYGQIPNTLLHSLPPPVGGGQAGDQFGEAVSVSGTLVVVGAPYDDIGASNAGSVYVYDLSSGTPTVPVHILNNPSPVQNDFFGHSVGISGTRVVVGVFQNDTGAASAGSAYVYDLSSGTPTVPTHILNNPAPAFADFFGWSVGISGTRVVVSATEDDFGATDAGSAYVYDLSSGTPTVPAHILNNPFPALDDNYGYAVAISGSQVVVTALTDDTAGTDSGSTYVYDVSSGTPTVPVATLNNPTPSAADYFGYSAAISGSRVVVGAVYDDTNATNAGSAYVYDMTSGTPGVPVLTLNNPGPAASEDFGHTVAISGQHVYVAATNDATGGAGSGTVYGFDLTSGTPAIPVATLTNPTPNADDDFGVGLALSGSTLVVGAHWDDTISTNKGFAYVYGLPPAYIYFADTQGRVGRYDPVGGTTTAVGNLAASGIGVSSIFGMAFDAATNRIMMVDNGTRQVHAMNATTGAATTLFTITNTIVPLGAAMLGGNFYVVDHNSMRLHAYTLAGVPVPLAGAVNNNIAHSHGLGVNPVSGKLCSSASTNLVIEINADGSVSSSSNVGFYAEDVDVYAGGYIFVNGGTSVLYRNSGGTVTTLITSAQSVAAGVTGGIRSIAYAVGSPVTSSPPAPVTSALGDIITANSAPDASGADSGLDFDMLTRGGYIAENSDLAFPGELTGPGVDGSNFKGFWKRTGSSLTLLARTGDNAPETGATAAKFGDLPLVPGINDDGQVTLFAALATNPLSTPPTTLDNDTGLWSELGGTGFQILLREGDPVPPVAGAFVGDFGWGCFATARTGASTGEAATVITMKGASTDSVLLRASITGPTVTAVGVVARENTAAPGAGGENFGGLNNTVTRSVRMDAQGNLVFGAGLATSFRTGIWYQPAAGGAPVKAMLTGEAAPGTTGATFMAIDLPVMGSAGTFAFRGVLNQVGDNADNSKNDGIWRGSIAGGFSNILRRGDSNTNRPGLFASGTIKAGNIWNGWLTNSNHGAWLGWVDLAGDGISAYPADTFGIYTDLDGSMNLLISSGDPAPGIAGASLFFVDHPVVSGSAPSEYLAFIATVTGGGTTAGTNDKGIWRSLNGAAPALVLRTGDAMTTTQGSKTIADIDLPGSGYADHIWETPVMDKDGRILAYVTFTDGSTSQVIVP